MASLQGQTISSSYEQLLTLPDGGGDTTTVVPVTDGDGVTTFAIQLASDKVNFTGNIGIGETSFAGDELINITKSANYSIKFEYTGQETFGLTHGASGMYWDKAGTNITGWTQDHDFTIYNNSGTAYANFDGSTSRLGIGTVAPTYPLDILSTGQQDMRVCSTDDTAILRISAGTNGATDTEVGYIYMGKLGGSNNGVIKYTNSATGTSRKMEFQVNGTAPLTLEGNGRVGIGTTGPAEMLHVQGTVKIRDEIFIDYDTPHFGIATHTGSGGGWSRRYGFVDNNDSTTFRGGFIGYGDDGTLLRLTLGTAHDTAACMHYDVANNRLGLGTTTPDCKLHVAGSAAFSGPSETFVTMAESDTSPDVSTGNIFKSHSTGVTIQEFDGGVCGQIITIISGGATVYDVTSSELKGGTTNITTATGDVTMWVCESATVWHLLSWMDLSIDLSSGGF